eukprot:3246734-Pleurochrysis_carterae.AAC.1
MASGGIVLYHLVELPGLGKSGGTIQWPKLTVVRPFGGTPEWAQANSALRRVGPRLLVTALLERLGHETVRLSLSRLLKT